MNAVLNPYMKFYVDVGNEIEWFIIDIVNFEKDISVTDAEAGLIRLGSENVTMMNWYGVMDNMWVGGTVTPTTVSPWRVFDSTSFPIGTTITAPVTPAIQYSQSLFDSNTQFAWTFNNNIPSEGVYVPLIKPFKETITGLC